MKAGNQGWPRYEQDELDAVNQVLSSGRVNYWSGEEGRTFEREFAAFHDMPHAIAVANGTLALELALQALCIGEGDEVVVTPRSSIASVSCVVARGARPVFADVDPDSGNLNVESVASVLTPQTRVIIAVHLAGWPCDLDALRDLADRSGLWLIEDCAQAHGATWHGRRVGSVGDAAAFSFCTDKIMSTGGEGGMLLLRNDWAWRRACSHKGYDKGYDKDWHATQAEQSAAFRCQHGSFGTNWRLTEMQSAIGRCQLRKLPEWLQRRQENAAVLVEALSHLPGLRVPFPPPDVAHACYKLYAFVEPDLLLPGWSRDAVVEAIQAKGGSCEHGGCSEIYREKAFEDTDYRPAERLPVAQRLGETSLMFEVDHTLSLRHMNALALVVAETLREAVGE